MLLSAYFILTQRDSLLSYIAGQCVTKHCTWHRTTFSYLNFKKKMYRGRYWVLKIPGYVCKWPKCLRSFCACPMFVPVVSRLTCPSSRTPAPFIKCNRTKWKALCDGSPSIKVITEPHTASVCGVLSYCTTMGRLVSFPRAFVFRTPASRGNWSCLGMIQSRGIS